MSASYCWEIIRKHPGNFAGLQLLDWRNALTWSLWLSENISKWCKVPTPSSINLLLFVGPGSLSRVCHPFPFRRRIYIAVLNVFINFQLSLCSCRLVRDKSFSAAFYNVACLCALFCDFVPRAGAYRKSMRSVFSPSPAVCRNYISLSPLTQQLFGHRHWSIAPDSFNIYIWFSQRSFTFSQGATPTEDKQATSSGRNGSSALLF